MAIPEIQNAGTGDVEQDKKQAAHDAKVKKEVADLLAEAKTKNVFISSSTINPEAIRYEIDRVVKARQSAEVESKKK